MKELSKEFFKQDTVKVAKKLLGKIIVIGDLKGRIVETEAYGKDPASHAFKRTERSAIMFDTYGHVYVYLIYGMYNCINFTTEKETVPGAVLIRAVEPLNEIELIKQRRKTNKKDNLCSGPGKLCQAFDIDKRYNNLVIGNEIKIYDDKFKLNHFKIGQSSRIGIKDALHLEWRFYIIDNEHVSKVKINQKNEKKSQIIDN
ncbi:DNA-3-methyladenine glycosylase [archaeon]|jgi:DNA-3-methyladenine glycosylase|nr:DNA-3-methyladenine glycosylase [archaeon]MBT5021486.1 DNA-3-methyladenine glycosylase [Candidatus Woesearchaeota archaeon]MBT6869507.1 DNA-3-methyladenine glycosylase [archaeon]MBT7193195.1 DNA-3-methyladenine glycosylase [archaeon]MBT7380501.1 DNA-3-methyladenine glycosylase [archaeon]